MSQESPSDILKKAEEYYKLARKQIVHEDNLINNRTNWLLATQGLLFAAFGVVVDNVETVPAEGKLLMYVFPLVGIFLTVITFLSVLGAALAMKNIKADWEEQLKQMSVSEFKIDLPPVQCEGWPKRLGFAGPFLIPTIFAAAWITIWIRVAHPLLCSAPCSAPGL
ncbi:MAG: RipA family octameric membrane protein [Planctomycetota bacterium]